MNNQEVARLAGIGWDASKQCDATARIILRAEGAIGGEAVAILALAAVLATEDARADWTGERIAQVWAAAARHHRAAERFGSDYDWKRAEKVLRKEEKLIDRLFAEADSRLAPDYQGDPRTYTVRVILPSGRSNSFGGHSVWGIDWHGG